MATIDSILNFAIPVLLILIALGFVYTKFLEPWVFPALGKLWEWMRGSNAEPSGAKREISYGE